MKMKMNITKQDVKQLPIVLVDIISKYVYQPEEKQKLNKQIENLQRTIYKADDVFIEENQPQYFWNTNHNVYVITTNKKYNMKSIYLDYITMRNLGFQWTYICNSCGEYLKIKNDAKYHCKCNSYIY